MASGGRLAALQQLERVPRGDEQDVGGDESVSEALSKQVFSQYRASSKAIDRGVPHPGEAAVEATSLRWGTLLMLLAPHKLLQQAKLHLAGQSRQLTESQLPEVQPIGTKLVTCRSCHWSSRLHVPSTRTAFQQAL